ncbi:MAG: EAL domain-containing protein [Alphaproteobacteria bacterium]|nr:EAL domain-containing protein [Alphaproteobacteria bacterium]MBV9372626.1 EAL domain-containing protein [Alphaproteobacteria bacterium]MBV9900534.1 EAL domain-containing protein [Alphaproteobacteria bacterium]
MGWGKRLFDRLTDAGEAESLAGRVLLDERYRALQRQIPFLYIVILSNLLGLALAAGGDLSAPFKAVTLLVALIAFRLVHWLNARDRTLAPERILRELKKTWIYAIFFSVGFCTWSFYLMDYGDSDAYNYVVLFGSLAAIGCAYGVSRYPAAAKIPLLLVGVPLSGKLILTLQAAHIGMGVSLGVVLLVLMRLLSLQEEGFKALVESRTGMNLERERARRAERLAKAEKAKAKTIADTDPLTGLANRRAFLRILGRRAAAATRSAEGFALGTVDLDGFKPINDTFGHAAGDAVLKEVGRRLAAAAVGEGALIARTGGDEFGLLLPGVHSDAAARSAGAAVCAALQEPFRVEGREFRISGCCGLTLLSRDDCHVEEALVRADTALYRAKQNGRAGVAVFSPDMDEMHRRRKQVETALREPEAKDRIGIVFQPIRDLATGELRAFEALARWDHPELGRIPPDQFIPVAEQINVIEEISDALLAAAAVEAKKWAAAVRLSFNVSAVQLCTAGSAERMLAVLGEAGMDPGRLQVEVTETALLVDFEVARRNLQSLREAGARIVLDDFGAGHASISYLREMQFDGIKLDGSLVAPVADSLRSRRLLKGVLDLCASMGLPCVAEHIETEEQMALLRELGCRDGQGFILSPPLHPAAAAALGAPAVRRLGRRKAA